MVYICPSIPQLRWGHSNWEIRAWMNNYIHLKTPGYKYLFVKMSTIYSVKRALDDRHISLVCTSRGFMPLFSLISLRFNIILYCISHKNVSAKINTFMRIRFWIHIGHHTSRPHPALWDVFYQNEAEKMADILRTTFLTAFSWMKTLTFQKIIHWKLFLVAHFMINQYWSDDGSRSNQCCLILPMPLCVTQPQWVIDSLCVLENPQGTK